MKDGLWLILLAALVASFCFQLDSIVSRPNYLLVMGPDGSIKQKIEVCGKFLPLPFAIGTARVGDKIVIPPGDWQIDVHP